MVFDTTQGAGACATRSVTQWERALLAQWFTATGRHGPRAVAAAYVSDRSRDDPRLRNMIVIAERNKSDRDFLVHRPLGENAWIVTDGRTEAELGRFRTLPEALHLIRPLRNQSLMLTSSRSDDQLTDAARRQ